MNLMFCMLMNMSPFKNYEKCYLFDLKSSFHSQDSQVFAIFSTLSALPDLKGHETGIIYDVMN